jgi:hypothetical protein
MITSYSPGQLSVWLLNGSDQRLASARLSG